MKNKISARNIGLLFRYEWMNQKKSFLLMLGVLQGVVAIFVMVFSYKTNPNTPYDILGLTKMIAIFIGTIFMISTVCMFIWQTKMLNRNFNQGNNSVPFMMLPASPTEKMIHTHLSYLLSFVAVCVVFFINIIIYIGLFMLIVPESSELIKEYLNRRSVDIETDIIYIALTTSFISLLTGYTLYLNANMFFKKSSQAKSIILLIALSMLYKSYLGILLLTQVRNNVVISNNSTSYALLTVIPLIALFYLFHCQIKEKEIR